LAEHWRRRGGSGGEAQDHRGGDGSHSRAEDQEPTSDPHEATSGSGASRVQQAREHDHPFGGPLEAGGSSWRTASHRRDRPAYRYQKDSRSSSSAGSRARRPLQLLAAPSRFSRLLCSRATAASCALCARIFFSVSSDSLRAVAAHRRAAPRPVTMEGVAPPPPSMTLMLGHRLWRRV